MIGNVYSRSSLENEIPVIVGLSSTTLISTVREARVETTTSSSGSRSVSLRAELPYDCQADGGLLLPRPDDGFSSFFLDNIFVGDKRLIGKGVGTRLVRAFVEKALEVNPKEERMHTSWIRLGAINAIENALPGLMRVELGKDPSMHYGFGTDNSLEQMLVEHPPKEGVSFMAWHTVTKIQ